MSRGTSNYSGSPVAVDRADEAGNATICKCATGDIPSGASGYAVGCFLLDSTTGIWYQNTGTISSCTFGKANIAQTNGKGYYLVATDTNGTTGVNVFGTTNGFAATITGVYLISKDIVAANITIADTAGTVVTIAKGTTSGGMVGGVTLTNTSITSTGTLQVVSSGTPNATVFIAFTVV